MDIEHYPYRFVKKDTEAWQGGETFMTHRLLYSFKSTKTNQTYWVWVEVYQHVINYQKSAYILLSKEALHQEPELLNILVKGFHDFYPYFE